MIFEEYVLLYFAIAPYMIYMLKFWLFKFGENMLGIINIWYIGHCWKYGKGLNPEDLKLSCKIPSQVDMYICIKSNLRKHSKYKPVNEASNCKLNKP